MDLETINSISSRFFVVQEIGKGSYGKVFKCYDLVLSKIVAIKVFNNDLPDTVKIVNREVETLMKSDHPNINKLISFIHSTLEGIKILELEYCEFDLLSLMGYFKNGSISVQTVKCYMKQILEALSFVNHKKIIHRDIKPSNIFLDKNNQIKIGDFGFARLNEESSLLSNRVVSINYRAPELVLGSTLYGSSIDIWSTACVFYEMMTGNLLFPGNQDNPLCLITAIFNKCGTPKRSEEWLEHCPYRSIIDNSEPIENSLDSFFKSTLNEEFIGMKGILCQMLDLNPSNRPTADYILETSFFKEYTSKQNSLPEIRGQRKIKNFVIEDMIPRPKRVVPSVILVK